MLLIVCATFLKLQPGTDCTKKIHVVIIKINLQELHLIALRYLQTNIPNYSLHLFIKNHSPIVGWTSNVVY